MTIYESLSDEDRWTPADYVEAQQAPSNHTEALRMWTQVPVV